MAKTEHFWIRVTTEWLEEIDMAARKEGCDRSEFIRRAGRQRAKETLTAKDRER